MNGETPLHEIVPGLYQIGVSPSPAVTVIFTYFLTRDDVSPAVVPTLLETWEDGGLIGWYIFLNEEILDGAGFVPAARAGLPSLSDQPGQPNPRGIVWLPAVSAFAGCPAMVIYEIGTGPEMRTLPQPAEFAIGGFALTLPDGVAITLDDAAPAFILQADLGNNLLSYYGVPPTFQPYGPHSGTWYFVVALTGNGAGSFVQEQIALYGPVLLQTFFGGFRYFYQDGEQIRQLQYPFTIPASPPATFYGFNLFINPSYPADPRWTRIELDLGSSPYGQNSASLRSPFFMTTAGGTITLAPFNAAGSGDPSLGQPGFGFCRTPAASPSASPDSLDYYLAPTGTFRVVQISGPTGSPDPGGNLWMPGLFAQEFFEIETGDLLGFVSGLPAYAPTFLDSQAGSTGSALDPAFQTAWARFPLGEAAGVRGYFGQPSASVFYGRQAPEPFPKALAALLSEPGQPVDFPVVPYAGIYAAPSASPVPAQTFTAFESIVLSGVRHAQAPILPGGPRLIGPASRSLRRLASRAGVEPVSYGLTPQGFLAGLDEEGSWILLTLARGPEDPSQVLSFGPPAASPSGTVDPLLGSALLGDQLFLVVSDPAHLGQFSNEIAMGGFNFKLDVGQAQGTILIFKYNTSASLADLARRTDLWSSKENFVSNLAATQQRILDALAIAGVLPPASPADPDSPFAAFRQLAVDPAWTGVLALGCAIDGNGMPLDLQMLLGGINGQLRAHHLGIQSTPTGAGTASPALESSSLFGVISYPGADQPPPPPASPGEDLDYEVELLHVVFANSKITQLNVTAGLTIQSLFGRQVEMAGSPPSSPPDTLSIPGQYQVQGGVGVVLFNSRQRFVYTFPIPTGATRVLEQIEFANASLVPVSSQPAGTPPTGTEIQARFALGGQLWFAAEPFPGAGGLDLFSFGTGAGGGLQFSNLTVNIQFTLDNQGAMQAGSKTVAFDWTVLKVSPSPAAIRSESLLYTLPLQLSAFVSGNPLQTASGGASPLHALQLEGKGGSFGSPALPGGSPQLAPSGYPYVTATPEYALQFDLPLGSLGSLSDVHVGLMARLFLGWGPSQLVPESDAAAVLVQLPQLSAGYGGFDLQGILRTTFGDANLLKVDLDTGPVYAVLFNNVKLSVLGYAFPPGYVIDFLLFGGNPAAGGPMNTNNLAWFLALQKPPSPSA